MQQARTEGIIVDCLGDSGAFSRTGKSSGFRIMVGGSQYLVDCGASIFQRMSGHSIPEIKGILLTHAHDDHKRYFTDLALFKYYAPDVEGKITLITTIPIHQAVRNASLPVVSTSLSPDSRRVVDIPYEDFVDVVVIGPRAKYHIRESEGEGEEKRLRPRVVDSEGRVVDPALAKVVIHPETNRGRILFRDPDSGRWVDPEIFYPSSATCFYHEDDNALVDPAGVEISCVSSISWHGVPATGFRFRTENESLLITGDTIHNRELWRSLCEETRVQRLEMPRREFKRAHVIYGSIDNYIEQTWSRERYEEAVHAFEDSVVIHEVAGRRSIVHTDYRLLKSASLSRDQLLLGHSPDIMVSEWVLCRQDRKYRIIGAEVFEEANASLYPFNADVYSRHYSEYFVGYKNPDGNHWVYERDGLLYISRGPDARMGELRYRVDLFQDINGEYYPALDSEEQEYKVRRDGRVELIDLEPDGSRGTVVKGMRAQLLTR